MKRASLCILALALPGCLPELGECDEPASQRVVYDAQFGHPAFEGQAMMISNCAARGICHASRVEPDDDFASHYGVPAGLSFDVQLSSIDESIDDREITRQRRARFRVVAVAQNILDTIDKGEMPPAPPAAADFYLGAPQYAYAEGMPVEAPSSDAGREILRNWLACGAPVVERSVARPDGVPAEVRAGLPLEPLEPTWDSIYTDLLEARCAGSLCHGGNSDAGFDISDGADETLAALTSGEFATASGQDCGEDGAPLIVPGDPEGSLFYQKLRPNPSCGDRMPQQDLPVSPENLAAIRDFIASLADS